MMPYEYKKLIKFYNYREFKFNSKWQKVLYLCYKSGDAIDKFRDRLHLDFGKPLDAKTAFEVELEDGSTCLFYFADFQFWVFIPSLDK
jgi:hypothetical protein